MYMLTWPGVQTIYGDLFIKDEMTLNPYWQLHLNSGMGLHRNRIKDELGLSSLRIFYPHLDIIQDRILPRLDLSILRKTNHWKYTVGANMAVRAPSVSEAYGFYLFNSFDKFDYIGNPYLKNEKAYALKMDIKFNTSKFVAAINLHHFYFQDYIIGIPQRNLSTMTIGAAGVKKYEQINYAQIFNSEASINYSPVQWLSWNGKLSYRRGWGAQTPALPLIQPFSYSSTVSYNQNNTRLSISMQGAAKQKFINEDYGEHALKGYFTMDVKAAQQLSVHKTNMLLNAGVENIFDRNYTTFADWNRIPRMGRNFFINCMVYLNNN
jgi:iron complex outermembrane receptor protein